MANKKYFLLMNIRVNIYNVDDYAIERNLNLKSNLFVIQRIVF